MAVSRELFERQCKRRFGNANPERMRLEHWEWMVRRGDDPYVVRKELGLALNCPSDRAGPDWCFERFGMSRTLMSDGRILCIAGEHEDCYDPDFCIYNDVIVLRPAVGQASVTLDSGDVEIHGYPPSVFPPTDFHSATLVGDRIIIVGRLGYADTREHGATPVSSLATTTYSIAPVATTGPCPGWIYKHHASYDTARHAITIRGGMVEIGDNDRRPNMGAHRLYLADLRWEVIAVRERHRRFLFTLDEGRDPKFGELGAGTFLPKRVPHERLLPPQHEEGAHWLDVRGIRVRFDDRWTEVRVVIEGELEQDVVTALLEDVLENLRKEARAEWTFRELHDELNT